MRTSPVRLVIGVLLATVVLAWLLMRLAPPDAAASNAYVSGQQDIAASLFLEASVREPGMAQRIYSAGSAQLGIDDLEAAALLERAYAISEGDDKTRAAYNAGIAYFRAGAYFDAVEAFRAVLILDPNDADARYNYELSLRHALPPTPSTQQQQTNPEDGQTDPTITPSPEPGGFDAPTPTPPREEFAPDPTQTPVGGTGDFADDADATPVAVSGGSLTIEQAMQLLDAAAQDALTIMPFYRTPSPGDAEGSGW